MGDVTNRIDLERFSLVGRVALVTGASRGIGWEIARGLAAAGAHVVLNGRDPAALDERLAALRDEGWSAEQAAFDVADDAALGGALESIIERHARLDIVVANVGIRLRRPTTDITRGDFAGVIDVNLVAAFDLAQRAALLMAAAGTGSIILISSVAAVRGAPRNAAYSASKAGLEGLARCLAVEFGPAGIRTNVIAPGGFTTEYNAALLASAPANRVPLRRWGEPDECAGAALFLASDASAYVNGHVLVVDGGMSISS